MKILNVHATNKMVSKHIRQELRELKKGIEILDIICNINTCASRIMMTKNLAEIKDLNDIILPS